MNSQLRIFLKIVKWVVVLILLVIITLAGAGYFYLRSSLPELDGVVKSDGVRAPVEIIRDKDDVPHIYAQNKLDAYWGLGYTHAQDRLWQMEFQRYIGQGRLSELFGPSAMQSDRLLRTIGINRAAESAWQRLSPETKAVVESYVAGINAYVSTHPGRKRPPEIAMLRMKTGPWSGQDVLALVKLMSFSLENISYTTEILRNDIGQAVGRERAQQLFPNYPEDGPVIERSSPVGAGSTQLVSAISDLQKLIGYSGLNGGGLGSNSWVVGGAKSTTGKPVLANDPHLASGIPSTWYMVHLSANDLDVIGATIPGLPMVIIGRNRGVSWGITHLVADVQDLFRERLDEAGGAAEFQGKMEPLRVVNEAIKARGLERDVQLTVRITRHGPLVSDVINYNNARLPADQRTTSATLEPMSFRWPALDEDDTTVESFLRINGARNLKEFEEALRACVSPAMNFTYADAEGNIAYFAAGRLPNRGGVGVERAAHPEGWSGKDEWNGYIPFEEMPRAVNPPEHFIVTANNRPASADYKYYLGNQWFPVYRAQRIKDLLEAKERLSPQDHSAIHGDTVSLQARDLLPRLLSLVTPRDDEERRALEMLKGWDGNVGGDSAAAAVYEAWFQRLTNAVVSDELGPELGARYAERFEFLSRFMAETLKDDNSPWCDDVKTQERETCGVTAEKALRDALTNMKAQLGGEMEGWKWNRLHAAVFPHVPFHGAGFLRRFFSRSMPNGGDRSTVNVAPFSSKEGFEQNIVPGYRQIVDMSRLDDAQFILAGGQSGHFLSPNYDDYLSDWQALRYRPMRLERNAVEQAKTSVLRIEP